MAAPPAALFPPMQMPPLPIRSPSPPPHFPIPGPHDSLRRLPKPLPDFDFDWAVPSTRCSPPGPRPRRPFSWTADDDDETIRFHARQNSSGSVASTPTAPSPSHSRWPSSAGSIVSSSGSRPSYEHDRPAAPPPDWLSGADSSPPSRRKPYFSTHHPRSPDMLGTTAPYPEPPIGAAQNSFRTPQVVVQDAPRGTGGAKAERANRTRVEKDGISDIICEIDAALDRIGGARAAALKSTSPLPSPGTPVRSEFGGRFKVRQESPLRHGRSVTMPENLGGVQGEEGNPGGGGGSLATATTRFNNREPHSPTTSSPLKGKPKRGAPLVGPPPVSSRARYRPVSDVVVAQASSVAAPKTTFPAPGLPANNSVNHGGKPTANTSIIRTAMAPDPSTALHSNPPCNKRCTMPPGALLSSGTTRSVSSGTTLVSNHSSLEQSGAGNGRSFSSPLGNIAAAASSTPALYCSPDTPPVPPVHRNAVSDPVSLTDGSASYPNQQHPPRPRALSTSSTPSPSASPSPSPYATAASTSRSTSGPSSHTNSTELFSSPQSSPSSRSRSPSAASSRSSSSSQRGRQLRRKFSPRRASLRELRDKHSDACLKRAFEWGVQRYLEGTIFWDGKEADLFLGPEGEGAEAPSVEGEGGGGGDVEERGRGGRPLLRPLDGVGGGGGAGAEQWSDCREWTHPHVRTQPQPQSYAQHLAPAYNASYNNSSDDVGDVWHDAASMDVGVGVALGDPYVDHGASVAYGYEQGYDAGYGGGGYGHDSGNGAYGHDSGTGGYAAAPTHAKEKESGMSSFGSGGARGWAEEVLGAAIG
ncbi:uncharacterized protein J3D65DRAFT_605746 [Phyllosticta citribraziliensis]|uniref:Uncharacterized protein n=1 Tax=Phyllosticta citribraziliensis TaxID=989973 RepID=A0ABR1LD91_9PEZI